MLYDLFCRDPLLRADLEGLGHIGAAILEVDPLGVPDNLTLALTHCSHFGLACVHARFQSSSNLSVLQFLFSWRLPQTAPSMRKVGYIHHTSYIHPECSFIYIDLKKKHIFSNKLYYPLFSFSMDLSGG